MVLSAREFERLQNRHIKDAAFWRQLPDTTTDFRFHIAAIDHDGQHVDFTAPLAFVGTEDLGIINALILDYGKPTQTKRNVVPIDGQSVAFAPSDDGGDAKLATATGSSDSPGGILTENPKEKLCLSAKMVSQRGSWSASLRKIDRLRHKPRNKT